MIIVENKQCWTKFCRSNSYRHQGHLKIPYQICDTENKKNRNNDESVFHEVIVVRLNVVLFK